MHDEVIQLGDEPEELESDLYTYEDAEANEPGPFYLFNPGMPLYNLHDVKAGIDRIESGELAYIKSFGDWMEYDQTNGRAKRKRSMKVGRAVLSVDGEIEIDAGAIRRTLMESYAKMGLTSIDVFNGLPHKQVAPQSFSALVRPVRLSPLGFSPDTDEEEELRRAAEIQQRVEQKGALYIYEEMASGARDFLMRPEASLELGRDRANLYRKAMPSVVDSMARFKKYAIDYLNKQDALIRKQQNGGWGKPAYDDRDRFYQWMLARKGVDDALTQIALNQGQRIEVVMPQQQQPAGVSEETMKLAGEMAKVMAHELLTGMQQQAVSAREHPDGSATQAESPVGAPAKTTAAKSKNS